MIRGERCGNCRVGEDVAHSADMLGDKCEIFGAGEWLDEFRKQVKPLKIFLFMSLYIFLLFKCDIVAQRKTTKSESKSELLGL